MRSPAGAVKLLSAPSFWPGLTVPDEGLSLKPGWAGRYSRARYPKPTTPALETWSRHFVQPAILPLLEEDRDNSSQTLSSWPTGSPETYGSGQMPPLLLNFNAGIEDGLAVSIGILASCVPRGGAVRQQYPTSHALRHDLSRCGTSGVGFLLPYRIASCDLSA